MKTPALSGPSVTSGTDPVTGPVSAPPLRSDPAERGRRDAGRGAASDDATWAIFQELRPQFDGLLPPCVVQDYVDQAVRDLLGSICVEALPEMAIRLAAVRHRLTPEDLKRLTVGLHRDVPAAVEAVLKGSKAIHKIAGKYCQNTNFMYIGRGINFAMAYEGALKIKEISYLHA